MSSSRRVCGGGDASPAPGAYESHCPHRIGPPAGSRILGPVVHPWHVIPILPFLRFHPSAAFLALSTVVPLSYHAAYLAPGPNVPWVEIGAFWRMEYLPFYVLLLGGWGAGWIGRERRGPAGPTGAEKT